MNAISRPARTAAWIAAGVLGGGLVTGVAVSQLGVATAASPSPSPSASGAPGNGHPRGPGGPLARLGGPLERFGGRIVHGEATVVGRNGKDEVVDVQHGKITSIDGSQIRVKSSDGFTATYTVDKTTRIVLDGTEGALSRLKTGDDVRVLAVKSGGTAVAKAVLDGVPPRPFGHGMFRQPPQMMPKA